MARNNVIGFNNALPWNLRVDLKRFKAFTWGESIVMGRRTYESLGRPLPGRLNVVVSSQRDLKLPGVIVVKSISEAILECDTAQVYFIGGASIYSQVLPMCDRMYLTHIDRDFEGDTFFPQYDKSKWFEEECWRSWSVECDCQYRFVNLVRVKNENKN